jgi:hypothetical protein
MTVTEFTRDELIAQIHALELKVMDLTQKIEDLKSAPYMVKLREAADLMAELGRIHNTPQAKYQWITGN